jgi:hypothetical protein
MNIPAMIAAFALCLTLGAARGADEASVLFSYHRSKHTQSPEGGGVWLGNSASGECRLLWGERGKMVDGAWFHPNGKSIAFSFGGKLYIMNNDGTDPRRYDPGEHWPPERDLWQYTENGVFWFKDTTQELYRFDPASKVTRRIPIAIESAPRSQLRLSNDGTRGFIIQYTPNICGGNKAITSSTAFDAFSAYTIAPAEGEVPPYIQACDGPWGHGNCVTPDGEYVLMNSWCCLKGGCPGSGSHIALNVYRLSDGAQMRSVCPAPTAVSMYNWEVPEAAVNSGDHVIVAWGNNYHQGTYECYMVNWTNPDERIAVPMPHACAVQNGWLGPLPSPYDNKPYLMPESQSLHFNAASDTTLSRILTIKNIGDATLGPVETDVTPASASWLTVVNQSADGNTQELQNRVNSAGLDDGEYRATVTVSGGGAGNQNTYAVILIRGAGYIAAPSDLTAALGGDSLLDVALSWTDNASNEEGYAVQRKSASGVWTEVKRTAHTAVTIRHTHDNLGAWEYRVQAYADSGASAWSNSAAVSVSGIEWIRLTAPDAHYWASAGSRVVIAWEANRVSDVELSYSTDHGKRWKTLLAGAGIGVADPRWGRYPWNVPDGMHADSVLIQINKYGEPDIRDVSGYFTVSTGEWPGLKVNCGSNAYEAPGWVEDDQFLLHPARGTYVWEKPIAMTGENLAPENVYTTNVYGASRTYHFPFVPDGEHTLRLHHVAHRDYFLSYDVDGATVLTNYNPYETCGGYTACVKEAPVIVSGGDGLTLRSYSSQNSSIENGIEIIPGELYTRVRPHVTTKPGAAARTVELHTLQGRLLMRMPAAGWRDHLARTVRTGAGVYVVRVLEDNRTITVRRISRGAWNR